jgi:streptogramin lyase
MFVGSVLFAVAAIGPRAQAAEGDITEFVIPTPGSVPDGITAAPDGNLWFTERLGNKIGRITPAGVFTEFPVPTPDSEPLALVVAPDGNVWFTEFKGNKIGRITPSGVVTEFAIPSTDPKPHGITVGPDGNLWFTELNTDKIARITAEGDVAEFPIPTSNSWPSIITSGPDGNLWFGEWKGDKIGRITTAGVVTEFATPTAGSRPHGITVGPDGNLWFTEFGSSGMGRITTAGVITEFPIPTATSKPAFVAAGPDGNLWFTEYNGERIGRITTSGVITEYPIPGGGGSVGLASSSTSEGGGSLLFTCEIRREWLQNPGWPSCAGPACPIGIAAGPDGNLWFTEFRGSKVGRITDFPLPSANLVPGAGPPGTLVQASGSGFGSFEQVKLTFVDSLKGPTALGTAMTDGGGHFAAQIIVPTDATKGRQRVVIKGTISRLRADRIFRVRS